MKVLQLEQYLMKTCTWNDLSSYLKMSERVENTRVETHYSV